VLSYNKASGKIERKNYERKQAFEFKDQDKNNFNSPIIVNDGPGGAGVHLSAMLIETTPANIRVRMFPVSETYSTYSDKAAKPPILDVTLEAGKTAKINSTTLKEVK
jgi:hypothetical protein